MKSRRMGLFLLLFLLAGGCQQPPQSNLPTVQMRLGGKTFTLEVAATMGDRMHGLMRRDSMPVDQGMIFVFDEPQQLRFYMKNTRIPLDIIFVDETGKVDSIKQMRPYDETTVPSDGNHAKWAIELNQGAAADAGVKVGDQLEIPPAAQKPAE